jgi:uncharacterized OB-fold protein
MSLTNLPPIILDETAADERSLPFWEATQANKLMAPKCPDCGTFRMPPGRFCPECLSMGIEWVELPGTGTVFSFAVVRDALTSTAAEAVPYVPAVITADGAPGIRFVSNVVGCDPDVVEIGIGVKVVFHRVSDTFTLPFWTLA